MDENPTSIEVSDDDDDDYAKKSKVRRVPTECLNVECRSGNMYLDCVPVFILSYYKVKNRGGLKVCTDCFDEACAYFANLKNKYENKESIYKVPCSQYKPVLSIDDSDEEDLSPEDDEEPLDDVTIDMIENGLCAEIKKVLSNDNTRFQLDDSYSQLIADEDSFLNEVKTFIDHNNKLQKEIDAARGKIYIGFKPNIKILPELNITEVYVAKNPAPDTKVECNQHKLRNTLLRKSVSYNSINLDRELTDNKLDSSQDVVAVSEEILVPLKTLPPPGSQVTKPKLKSGDVVYVMKHSYKYPWKHGMIVNIISDKGLNEYQLKLSTNNKKTSILLTGKYLAYKLVSPFRFTVGCRVIAVFKEEGPQNSVQELFYSGIVAEPPKAMNKFRYLIFFDDGCAQYCPHENIRQILEPSTNPWDDIPIDSRDFIKKYLLEYPERPMVKLQRGNVVRVEYQNQWLLAKVMEIDGSLVKMLYQLDGRIEWIYRGSARLEPLFKELEVAKRRKETGDRIRRISGKYNANSPYVEYTHNADVEEADDDNMPRARAVARKSTNSNNKIQKCKKPIKWTPMPLPGEMQFKKLVGVPEPKKFVVHQCGLTCISWTYFDKRKAKEIGALAIPLHFGFRRIISHFGGGKRSVLYKAPCGRSLRNMEEVHMYLRITKSEMTVDLFDFDYWVNCLAEFVIEKCNVHIPDITQSKENCPISCVNYIDNTLPEFSSYLTEREPRENVGLNLDPAFLCGCDCTDDCQDREKCSCWQMTIEGQKLIPNNVIDPNVGYHYRRLPERVITGIYECNQQCKCSRVTCLNRVVQYPLSQKLQLFKTQMKGWGIRCLNDIPQGSFICVYAGHLLTEQEANEEGKNYGDEYLAELDYIEVIESTKQDYESDVPEDLEEDMNEIGSNNNKLYDPDSPASSSNEDVNADIETETSDSIRMRLRERKAKQTSAVNNKAEKKKKEKKEKEFISIRKYYGDNESEVFIMDAKCSGNIGRYLNHSCMPNVFVQNVFVDTHDLRFPWVAFFAQTYIIAGTELTWDYNYDIGSVENKIKYCYCGSSKCRGRLL